MGKIIVIYLALIVLLFTCVRSKDDAFRIEIYQSTPVIITDVNVAKHSRVHGVFDYKGKPTKIISTDGYYYKEYTLIPGDTILYDVAVYFYRDGDEIEVEVEDMNLQDYEIPK